MFIWYSLRDPIKSKFIYICWRIAFDGGSSWSFGNDFARNVVIISVDNNSSYHTNNQKNNFLVLAEGPTDGINDSTVVRENKISINVSKEKTQFRQNLHYKDDESYWYVNKTEICKLKASNNINWYNFCLGSISKDFTKYEQSGISLTDTVYDSSLDHSSNKKEDILNIHQYLMV